MALPSESLVSFLAACITGSRLPETPPHWPHLLEMAEYHRLTPILARATRNYPKPDAVNATLAAAARENTQQNLVFFSHTVRIGAALDREGIDALAIKGPVLAYQLHGDLSLRVCSDVDVLVRAEQFARAARALCALGYTTDASLDEASLQAHLRFHHDLAFEHADGTLIELHANIAQPHYSYRTDLDRWFERAQTVAVSGHHIRTPCSEHALVLAIVHGTKHAWSRLDLLADVAAIARRRLDWKDVLSQIDRMGARRAATLAGILLRDVLDLPSPLLTDHRIGRRFSGRVKSRMLFPADPTYWETRLFDFRVRERASDRLRYVTNLYRKWSAG